MRNSTGTAWLVAGIVLFAPAAQARLVISSDPTQNVSCSGGSCAATARAAVLNVSDLAGMLAGGDVTVSTAGVARNIKIDAALSWTSGARLTLAADRGVVFDGAVVVAGPGALTISESGAQGSLSFTSKGHVEFWDPGSSLVVNGANYAFVSDLAGLAAAASANPSGLYALAKSYDATNDGTYRHSVVRTTFSGTFEGLGNAISNVKIKAGPEVTNVGLFAQTGAGAMLRDVVIAHETVTSLSANATVGGLVAISDAALEDVSVDATVTAKTAIQSGIVVGASLNGSIFAAASSGSIVGLNQIGGIVGCLNHGAIGRSHSSADVSVSTATPGSAASSLHSGTGRGTFDECDGFRSIERGNWAGGLLGGTSGGTITECYATGAVEVGDKDTGGGLVGLAVTGIITNSYATGPVSAGSSASAGGLVGTIDGEINTSYSTGAVTGGGNIGGAIGSDDLAGIFNIGVYWDLDTSGIDDPSRGAGSPLNDNGVTGLTNAQLTSGLPADFLFRVWASKEGVNNGLPFLKDLAPPR
jgi:hypothetical protein